jgi:DNA polymerase III sliding clamp (beta) subunit (PCNA family)
MIAKAIFDKESSKRVINALKLVEKLDNTIYLVISEDGMEFHTLDRSHISLAFLKLKPSMFEYNCDKEKVTFKPDCEYLKKVLAAYRNGKDVLIIVEENNLILEYFDGVNAIKFKSQFGTIDEHYDHVPKVPDVKWPAKYTVCFKDFKDVVCAASSISEKLYFKSSEETDHILTCFAEHSEKGEEKVSMDASFQTDTEYKDRVFGCYATSRVQSLISSRTPFSDEVSVGLGEDIPLSLIFRLENVGQLEFLTAPRIAAM